MVGIEIIAPKGYGFVSIHCDCLAKGSNGYNNPSMRNVDGCDRVKDEPTRYIITSESDSRDTVFISATLTDKDGNIMPWSSVVKLKQMKTEELSIPTDFGTVG